MGKMKKKVEAEIEEIEEEPYVAEDLEDDGR